MTTKNKASQADDVKNLGFKIFGAIGKFSVKFRWLVVLVWIVGTVLAVQHLPSLSSVTQSDNTTFLPANAPSEKAINLANVLGKTGNAPTIPLIITTNNGKSFTAAEQQYVQQLTTSLTHVSSVVSVRNDGQSNDGQAQLLAVVTKGSVNTDPTPFVSDVRNAITKSQMPANLQVHLSGQIADAVDNSKKSGSTDKQIQLGSGLFIIALLLVIFRAPLAPIITLIPPLFVVTLAGPLIAEAAKHGLKVSSLSQLLLTVLVLGAGTDYGLFLIFRIREEVQRGMKTKEAIVKAMSRVGETITFSAATVIAALLSLSLATFQLYATLGTPLAIGIALMLLAGLTLLPALIAIFGRAVFWPSKRTKEATKSGFWGRVSSSVIRRPVPVLIVGVVIFSGLALFVTQYHSAGFGGTQSAPGGSDAAQGDALATKHFPSISANPTAVIFVLPESVWHNATPLATIQSGLESSSLLTHITGPLNPNGISLTPQLIEHFYEKYGAPVGPSNASAITHMITMSPELSHSPTLVRDFEAYQILANMVSKDGRTIELAVGLAAGDPGSTVAMNTTPAIRSQIQKIASSVHATDQGVIGESTALYDISSISSSDLKRVVPVAIIVIGVLLAILLRSLVAPVYLIISVALSYLASLGISVLIFMEIGHAGGLTFILPFLMFIFLLALGEDYNILVMTRIREEAHGLHLREAVSQALTTTGTTVTSAGLVLAGTFGVLAVVGGNGSSEVRDIGTGLALGILMDTFLVRTLLVPSMVVLLGRWNWWPTKHGTLAEASQEP